MHGPAPLSCDVITRFELLEDDETWPKSAKMCQKTTRFGTHLHCYVQDPNISDGSKGNCETVRL